MNAIYLDTCSSDYFQGFGGPVVCTSVGSDNTMQSVMDDLLDDLQSGDLWLDGSAADENQWEAAERAIRYLFTGEDMSARFVDLDPCSCEEDYCQCDPVYVYVGLKVE